MDELLFTGLAEMTPEDRAPLVAHVMDQSNWATVRGKNLGAESTAEGAGAIVVFPWKPVGKAPPAAAARATKRSKPIPVPKPTAVPKAEPKAAEPKAIDLTGASTDEDDAAAANPQPPKRPRGRPTKQPRAPAPTSPAGGYASGNAVVAVPAKGPKKSAAAAAIVRRADGGVAPHLQLAGKTIVLTGVFPEVGGGCGLMVVCDFAVTHAEAKLGYPEVDLGICPAVVAPWLMKKIGAGAARAMLLAGGTMSGEEGFRRGLATHLVAEGELAATAQSLAKRLAKGGPKVLAATKHWLNELDGSLDDAIADEAAEISARIIADDEAQARLKAAWAKA